jgi:hypothetical protein
MENGKTNRRVFKNAFAAQLAVTDPLYQFRGGAGLSREALYGTLADRMDRDEFDAAVKAVKAVKASGLIAEADGVLRYVTNEDRGEQPDVLISCGGSL